MHSLDWPCLRRIFKVLQIGGIVLLSNCKSDPIVLNPSDSYDYKIRSFQIDSTNVYTVQGDRHTGHSPKLYSGILSLPDNVEDTAYVLIRLLPELLDTQQVCNNPESISKVNISLTSITQLAEEDTSLLIQKDSLKIYLLPQDHISENWNEDIILNNTHIETISNNLNGYLPLHDSLIYIDNQGIEIQLYKFDNSIIDNWCANQDNLHTSIIILYTPDLDILSPEEPRYLEFASSDADASLAPKLDLEYQIKEEAEISKNRYSILTVESSHDSLITPYYINNDTTELWGTVYAVNMVNSEASILEEPLDMESIIITEDIISITQLDSSFSLVNINIMLNPEIQDSIDEISFWLSNVAAYISATDPSGDNYYASDSTGSEGNGQLDWTDFNDDGQWNDGEGEKWFDFGEDNCPDIWETGMEDNPCDSTNSISAYNIEGSEGNNQLDWLDTDGDGLWTSDIDTGEEWRDIGIDGCEDIYEAGGDTCNVVENPNWVSGLDPNDDNFIEDPVGDDWHELSNPDSSEGNYQWDLGEPFYDWGSDGLPASITGYYDEDSSEGNDIYDIGEPFDDTGSDGKISSEEDGYNYNGTEGNGQFDSEGEFNDCGEDNCCDSDDNLGICDDASNDNYNIDPNEDNWNAQDSTSIGTEGNGLLDWTDEDEDGLWTEGVDPTELWYDWGLDAVHDSLEAFQTSSIISPNLYNNNYIIDIDEGVSEASPELVADTVSLWISQIQTTDNSLLNIEISVQTHIALKALKFQLNHTLYTLIDTILQSYQPSIASIGDSKFFQDITILPRFEYSQTELNNTLQIEYANDLITFINFDSLSYFLEKEEYIFSYPYSNLVMYIDTNQSVIHDDGMWLFLGFTDSDSIFTYVSSSADSIEFPVGQIMAGFQNGDFIKNYEDFKLMTNSSLYNYSRLSIVYNLNQPSKNPRLDIMYTNQ